MESGSVQESTRSLTQQPGSLPQLLNPQTPIHQNTQQPHFFPHFNQPNGFVPPHLRTAYNPNQIYPYPPQQMQNEFQQPPHYPQLIPSGMIGRPLKQVRQESGTKSVSPQLRVPPIVVQHGNLKNVPAFLNKLFNMVNSTGEMICWAPDGLSFVVERHEEFSKEILPRFFKHNNFSSFVRQLNMYGFHKIPHMQQGAMHAEQDHEVWEFSNMNFQRDKPDLLTLLSRKKTKADEPETPVVDLATLAVDIENIKRNQLTLTNELGVVQRENTMLWRECGGLRVKYQKQTETVNKILRFLASVIPHHQPVQAMPQTISQGLPQKRRSGYGEDDKQNEGSKRLLLLPAPGPTNEAPSKQLPKLTQSAVIQHQHNFRHIDNTARTLGTDIQLLERNLGDYSSQKRIQNTTEPYFDSNGSVINRPQNGGVLEYNSVDEYVRYETEDEAETTRSSGVTKSQYEEMQDMYQQEDESNEQEMADLLAYMQPALERHERNLEVLDTDTFKVGCGVRQDTNKRAVTPLSGLNSPSAFLDFKGSEGDTFQDFFSGMLEL